MPGSTKTVVVMPAYNAANTLKRTVDDLPMSHVDEVVVVDDRSTDDTVKIARELGLPLRGLVAGPIALETDEPPGGPVLVVDVTMHRSTVATVERGERVHLGATSVCPDVSLEALRRQWIKALGEEFVRTTRFDPRHDAATEDTIQFSYNFLYFFYFFQ